MEAKQHDVIIVGAGLSGLGVAHFLHKLHSQLDVVLIEKEARPGGAIKSMQEKGFLFEWGPHGFLDNIEESRELLDDLRLEQEMQKAPLKSFVRYVCLKGRLIMIPQSPLKILKSPFLPFGGKLRILADLWKKPRRDEQTVAEWCAYRFGRATLPLVDAAITGTYAGDMERLSIDAVMPGVRRLEQEKGSVIRGVLTKKKDRTKKAGFPSMVSFRTGMEELVRALARERKMTLGTVVQNVTRQGTLWKVQTTAGEFVAPQLILALQINQALRLLGPLNQPPRENIPESKLINVVMGFGKDAEIPFGFGYLAPEKENRFAMGALFSTHMFPGRAPQGMSLLEVLVGGRRHPERLELDDETLVSRAYNDLRALIPLPNPPQFVRVLRPAHGIPQPEMGHLRLLDWRDHLEQQYPGLFVCGFGWDGIGMNDMIKRAKRVASQLIEGRDLHPSQAAVKGVYF